MHIFNIYLKLANRNLPIFVAKENMIPMKKYVLAIVALFGLSAVNAQNCEDLFISEYVEGTNNNKAIEIYNPTGNIINLSEYRLIRWDNGSTPPGGGVDISTTEPTKVFNFPNQSTIAPLDVVVISLNVTDAGELGGLTDTALVSKADYTTPTCNTSTNTSRTICFNGDDAMELQKFINNAWVSVDIFACIGERPVNFSGGTSNPTGAWTNLAPYSSPPVGFQGFYSDYYWTQDQTLIRKASVLKGTVVNPQLESWNPAVEWDSLPANTYSNLGSHLCDCASMSTVNEGKVKANQVILFPTPASDVINIQALIDVKGIKIYNLAGSLVAQRQDLASKYTNINVEGLSKGVYMAEIALENGQKITHKFIKN